MLSVGNPPAGAAHQRKLVAILCADIAGFSRLMGEDETATYEALARLRGAIDPLISQHGGRIVSTAGDGLLADFASIVDALGCAVEIQDEARRLNEPLPSGRRLELRIGVNLGDVIVAEDSDLYGDGVNIAARLQALASPGGICLSQMVYDQVKNKLALDFRPLGTHRVKNIVEPVRAYAVGTGSPVAAIGPITRRRRTVATICGFILVNAGLLAWLLGGPAVRESRVATGHAAAVAALAVPARLAERTPIAVLPFKNLSPDAGQDFFSDGISEDLINALGRFSNLLVAAKSASFQFKGRDVSPAEVGRVLDVRYLVEGSIRKSGDRLRVSVEVTEAATGFHLWSDMYNAELKDVFTVQDEITQRIVGAAAVKLTRLERDRALRKPTANLAAYEYLLRGRADLSNPSRAANYEARAQFQHAIDLDPNYAVAYAALGWAHYEAAVSGWVEFPDYEIKRAEVAAQKALALDPSTTNAYRLLARVAVYRRDYDGALVEIDRALALNPSDAEKFVERCYILLWSSKPAEAVPWLEATLRIDGANNRAEHTLGIAKYFLGHYEEAVAALDSGLARSAGRVLEVHSHAVLAAAYARLGRQQDVERERATIAHLSPFFDAGRFAGQFGSKKARDDILTGLRAAGFR